MATNYIIESNTLEKLTKFRSSVNLFMKVAQQNITKTCKVVVVWEDKDKGD